VRLLVRTTCVIALSTLLMPSQARAFCRTTTARAPADYDATQSGCFAGTDSQGRPGLPLFWRNACIGYNVHDPPSRKVSYDDATNALSIAFTVWSGASCPTEGEGRSRASIDVRDLGPARCDAVQYKGRAPNQNIILFRDDTWDPATHGGPQVLGLTTVVFAPDTGEIFGADMEINTKDMEPIAFNSDSIETIEKEKKYDFLSVVTHEAGHFLGIGHSDSKGSTMFARYDKGEVHQRILAPDDVNAVCNVYRPDGTRAVLGDKVTVAPGCDPTPRGGFTRECEDAPPTTVCSVGPVPGRTASSAAGWTLALGVGILLARRGRRRSVP
jgi:matrixin